MTSPLVGGVPDPGDTDDTPSGGHTFRDGSSMVIDKAAFSAFAMVRSMALVACISAR